MARGTATPIAAGRNGRLATSRARAEPTKESARAVTRRMKDHGPCALPNRVSVLKNWHREASTRGGLRPTLRSLLLPCPFHHEGRGRPALVLPSVRPLARQPGSGRLGLTS